ncbi:MULTISPECIES: DUF1990 family protein [unclassified Aeromicrobium]|uniref:DUF1990 family protein n=1 Tax=unclassified Aeromicrobium TaxID=2633570 RepID=UPI00396AF855
MRRERSDLRALSASALTYPEVGATRGDLPNGYRTLVRRRVIGRGRERFEEAARTLLGWDLHRRAGLGVRASSPTVLEGAVAVLRVGWGPFGMDAPVRVVQVIDEPRRQGFAYGTLPGHPESGEESFVVELDEAGAVVVAITAFSRHATLVARLGGPVTTFAQSRITERYLRAA